MEREQIVLTVAEGKRLIGMGVAASPWVQRALKEGTIGIARGSTNAYVAEAILGRTIDRTAFVTGATLPAVTCASFEAIAPSWMRLSLSGA